MTNFESLSASQKIRAALHRDVRSICTETCHLLGWNITNAASDVVAELVYKKLSLYGLDLEAFAKHAKRTMINADDVKLLVRRNPSLKANMSKLSTTQPGSKDKRRKTVALPVARHETSIQKPRGTEDTPLRKPEEIDNMMSVDLTFD